MNRQSVITARSIPVQSISEAGAKGQINVKPRASGGTVPVAQSPDRPLSLKLLRFPAVRERTGLSRSTIWRLERQGNFPRHRRISANVVAWVEEEVMNWIRSKVGPLAT